MVAIALTLTQFCGFLRFGYVTNDTMNTSIHVSNWGLTAIAGSTLRWEVVGSNSEENLTICAHSVSVSRVAQGPPTAWAANVK